MTQEEKNLLLKDLCARLPYGVKVRVKNNEREREWYGVSGYDTTATTDSINKLADSNFKPYLRPMSSMTEKKRNEFEETFGFPFDAAFNIVTKKTTVYNALVIDRGCCVELDLDDVALMLDWLNSHHFDYRGLIEKGLALEAPEGMYNEKEK